MKITYVINVFRLGAVSNILMDIIPYIKEKGYEAEVLSLQSINKQDAAVKKCRNNNIELKSLNLNRKNLLKTYFKLLKYFKEQKPDIIHSHLGRADVFSALCKSKKSKLITTFHSIRKNYNFLTKLGYLFTDEKVDIRISVSKTVKKSWYDNWKLDSNHCIIYNPINIERIEEASYDVDIKKEFNIKKEDYFLINVGRLIEPKGHKYLIKAMRKVVNQIKNVKLVIAGDGPLKADLKKQINDLNLQNNVQLVGFRNDVPTILKTADLFVAPSIYEGQPIAILEAMAAKVPVISSTANSIKEVISDEKDGFLVDYNNIDEMAKRILELLNKDNLKNKFIKNAYLKTNNLFNSKRIANKYIKLYNKLIE